MCESVGSLFSFFANSRGFYGALAFLLVSPLGMATGQPDGAELYRKNCASCHGDDGKTSPIDSVPINTQSKEELTSKLAGYKDGSYGGPNKKMMQMALKKLTEEDVASIITFMESFE